MVQQSLIEKLDGLTVGKSRMFDNFDGDSLDEMWTVEDYGITASMEDGVDEGAKLVTGSVNIDNGWLDFNDIRHYAHDGSVFIAEVKRVSSADCWMYVGLSNTTSDGNLSDSLQIKQDSNSGSNVQLFTKNSSSSTDTDMGIAVNNNFNTVSGIMTASSALGYVAGVLGGVSTSTLSTTRMQPTFWMGTRTTAAKTGHIRFMEIFNT